MKSSIFLTTILAGLTAAAPQGTPDTLSTEVADFADVPKPTLQKRACFNELQFGNDRWGNNQAEARTYAALACREGFTGTYNPGRVSQRCFPFRNGGVVFFRIRHVGGGAIGLGQQQCVDFLNREINGCSTGGVTSYGSLEFMSDPNNSC